MIYDYQNLRPTIVFGGLIDPTPKSKWVLESQKEECAFG
jgi:hypothetical protein